MRDHIARPCCGALLILAGFLCFAVRTSAQQDSLPRIPPSNSSKAKTGAAKPRASLPGVPQKGEVASGQESPNPHDDSDLLEKRAEWFYRQRASAGGHIPPGAYQRAFQHMQRMLRAEGKVRESVAGENSASSPLVTSTASLPAWTPIGPSPTTGGEFSPVTGRVMTIAVDPNDSSGNTVLLGGAMGGIWRSTDAGASWTAVGDQNASLAMGSIAFAPSNHSTVYAATGESESVAFDIYYGA